MSPTQVRTLFAERLVERREALNLTQAVLAKKLGISDGAVSKWENGEREPDLTTLIRLAGTIHTSVDWLIGAPEAQVPPKPRIPRSVWKDLKRAREGFEAVARVASYFPPPDDEGKP